jgi:microsomal dipeptidase-like Zn-dependent dipeptidase
VEIMLEHGYGEGTVEDIMGRNWLRLYENLF